MEALGFQMQEVFSHHSLIVIEGKVKQVSFLFFFEFYYYYYYYYYYFFFFCVCEESIVKVTDYNLKTKRVLVSPNY